MAWFDLNDKRGSAAYGSVLAKLWGFFVIGAIIGMWIGFAPFWVPRGWNIWNFEHAWSAIGWALPLGFFGGIPYMEYRFARDHKKASDAATLNAAKAAVSVAQRLPKDDALATSATGGRFKGLQFGSSIGELLSRDHVAGVKAGEIIFASEEDVCKNTVVFGGIGSGKTTRGINNFLKQIFEQLAGALIFDIKGDFGREVDFIARITGRTYITVGHGGLTLNLIRGTSPELAASYLKSCFIASGSASGNGAFFVDQAVELCRNALTMIHLIGGDYSLAGLYDVVFSAEKRESALGEMLQGGEGYTKRQFRLAESVGNYFANIHGAFDDKMLSSVNSTVAQVLSPFSHPDLIDAFSGSHTDDEADLTALLEGAIYFVSLPMTLFGKEGARYAYMLIKLRFMSLMRERRTRRDWNQVTPVAFICDEYQAICDSVTDTDFWDKSRSSGCFGIVSMQGVSSLLQAVGSKLTADAILQNFRQRLIFRTEDEATMNMVQKILGQVDVHITSTSDGSSSGVSGPQQPGGGLPMQLGAGGSNSNFSEGTSYGESTSIQRQQLFDANDFRRLTTSYALFIGNLGDRAVDEVITMQPLYVKE